MCLPMVTLAPRTLRSALTRRGAPRQRPRFPRNGYLVDVACARQLSMLMVCGASSDKLDDMLPDSTTACVVIRQCDRDVNHGHPPPKVFGDPIDHMRPAAASIP